MIINYNKKEEPIETYLDICDINTKYRDPVVIPDFLTRSTCDLLIKDSIDKGFIQSQVADYSRDDINRKSNTCWLNTNDSTLVKHIYDKCQEYTSTKTLMEDIQIVYYKKGDHFKDHYDQCNIKDSYCLQELKRFHSPRYCTILIYLNDPTEYMGGETVFPNLERSFKQPKGTALLFYNLDETEKYIHPKSLHRSNPITNGTKWICNIWIRRNHRYYHT